MRICQKKQRQKERITHDLETLLHTRSARLPDALSDYPTIGAAVVKDGLIGLADMCMSSDTDQKRSCAADQLAIERHKPRLHRITAALKPRKGTIDRIDFVITAELKNVRVTDPMQFSAAFQPPLPQHSIQSVRNPHRHEDHGPTICAIRTRARHLAAALPRVCGTLS